MTNIELDGSGAIKVRQKDGRFRRVSTPNGVTDELFRNAVAAFDTAYRLNGVVPDVNECHRIWPKITKAVYASLFLTAEFKAALAYRGVDWEPETAGISTEQSYAITALSNPTDRRSQGVKLRELGVSPTKWQAWMRQPLFAEVFRRRAESNLSDAIPIAINALIGNAESGDNQAIKLLFEMTGRYNPTQVALDDARTVVMAMVEAVVKHTSPEVRELILADVQAAQLVVSAVPKVVGA